MEQRVWRDCEKSRLAKENPDFSRSIPNHMTLCGLSLSEDCSATVQH